MILIPGGIVYGDAQSKAVTLNKLAKESIEDKDYKMAIVNCDRAIDIDPGYTEAWCTKGLAYVYLKDNEDEWPKYEESIQAYDTAIEIGPNTSCAWIGKADVLMKLKKYDESLLGYDKAIEIDPDNAVAWEKKADLLLDQSKNMDGLKIALETYKKALNVDPHNENVKNILENSVYYEFCGKKLFDNRTEACCGSSVYNPYGHVCRYF
jgi:tetratricopeptide (TPR) repeat protein